MQEKPTSKQVTSAEMDLFHSEIRRKPGQALAPISRKYRALDGFGHLGNWNLCVKHVPLSWFCWKLDWCTFEAKPHYFSQWSPLVGPEILSTWPIVSHFKSMISSRWWIWEGVKKEAGYHNFTYSWSRPMFTWWINLGDSLDLNVWATIRATFNSIRYQPNQAVQWAEFMGSVLLCWNGSNLPLPLLLLGHGSPV